MGRVQQVLQPGRAAFPALPSGYVERERLGNAVHQHAVYRSGPGNQSGWPRGTLEQPSTGMTGERVGESDDPVEGIDVELGPYLGVVLLVRHRPTLSRSVLRQA